MMPIAEMIQVVVWTVNAKLREQLLMLRILDIYGSKEFDATFDEIAEKTLMKRSVVIKAMTGLKDLGWIESERNYKENGTNLPVVQNCKYRIIITDEKEPVTSPTE